MYADLGRPGDTWMIDDGSGVVFTCARSGRLSTRTPEEPAERIPRLSIWDIFLSGMFKLIRWNKFLHYTRYLKEYVY